MDYDLTKMLLPPTAPPKPAFGDACNGCGVCCQQEVCPLGRATFGEVAAPCPALVFGQARFWCALVLGERELRRQDPSEPPCLETMLAIGLGCDSEAPAAGTPAAGAAPDPTPSRVTPLVPKWLKNGEV